MNLVFISYNLKDPEAWRLALGIDKVIHVKSSGLLLAYRDASIALDEMIYIDRQNVDFVLFCNNEAGIKWSEFLARKDQIDRTSDSVYFTQTNPNTGPIQKPIVNLQGNFYCRPHVLTIMGSLYKLNFSDTNIYKESRKSRIETTILYGLIKGGYQIKLI